MGSMEVISWLPEGSREKFNADQWTLWASCPNPLSNQMFSFGFCDGYWCVPPTSHIENWDTHFPTVGGISHWRPASESLLWIVRLKIAILCKDKPPLEVYRTSWEDVGQEREHIMFWCPCFKVGQCCLRSRASCRRDSHFPPFLH